MRVLGLTGGMAMGKSNAAAQLRRAGLLVFDADAVVHRLRAPGGAAVPALVAAFPACRDGAGIDPARLRASVAADPAALRRLEAILHPLVRRAERDFLRRARRAGHRWAVLDIPLLYETGAQARVDRVLLVSAPSAIQRARLHRRGRAAAEIAALLARQWPDAARRQRADIVIRTGLSRAQTCRQLRRALHRLRRECGFGTRRA